MFSSVSLFTVTTSMASFVAVGGVVMVVAVAVALSSGTSIKVSTDESLDSLSES